VVSLVFVMVSLAGKSWSIFVQFRNELANTIQVRFSGQVRSGQVLVFNVA